MTGTIAIAAQTAETIITVHVAIARGHHQFTEGSIIAHAHALGSLEVAIARGHHHLAQIARMIVWPCYVVTHNSARAPL
jgi:hypothetical protein